MDALDCFERAEPVRPAGNDDAILRWNTCVRVLQKHPQLRPSDEMREEPLVAGIESGLGFGLGVGLMDFGVWTMPTILIVTGDGGESYETWFAVHRFQEAGYETRVAAPSKKRLHLVMHDFEPGWDTYREAPGYGMESDLTFADVVVDDYEAIVLIGGRAPEYLRNDARLIAIIREFDRQGKWIFSICHGVQLLAAAGLLKGRGDLLRARAHRGRSGRRALGRGRRRPRRPDRVGADLAGASGVLPRDLRLPAGAGAGVISGARRDSWRAVAIRSPVHRFLVESALMMNLLKFSPLLIALAFQAKPTVEAGFTPLFNGKDFTGWKLSNPASWTIEDGAMKANGTAGHVFYDGPFRNHMFRNFELKVDVMTRANSNGGIYVLTEFQETGFPKKGFEIQVNNSYTRTASRPAASITCRT